MNIYSIALASSVNYYRVNLLSNTAEMILMMSQPVGYEIIDRDQHKIIEFDKPINLYDLKLANIRLSPWLINISSSYDTLQVNLKPDVDMSLKTEGNNIRIVFRKKESADDKNINSKSPQLLTTNSSLALNRVNARLDFETGKKVEARQQYRELLALYPEKTELMLDLASVETSLYDWREALRLYEKAEARKPLSSAISRDKQSLMRTYGDRLTTAISYNKLDRDNTQIRLGLLGRKLLQNGAAVFADYTLYDVDDQFATRRIDGSVETFEGKRYSLGLGFETRFFSGEQKISAFVGSNDLGLSWGYLWANNIGLFGVQAGWQVPWYETSEAMAGYGTQDQLALSYSKTFLDKLDLSSSIALNNYGLDGLRQATKSYRLQLATRYRLNKTNDGFSLGYSLDKESVRSEKTKVDSADEQYVVLPLDDREQHLFTLWWVKQFSSVYIFESNVGFEYDRLREVSSPYILLNLNYQPNHKFEMNAYLESGLSTYNEGTDEYLSIGAYLNWYF